MAEKNLNEISRDVRVIFQKGSDALIRENLDYAIELFNQVLEKEPGLYDCRKALRAAQVKKAGSGGGFFKKAWSSASASPQVAKGQLALRRNPAEALQIAEQILNSDPANSGGHRIVVEASNALDLPRTAALSLEVLVKNSPKDKHVAIEYANALAQIGEGVRAEKFLSEVIASMPYDQELLQAQKDISARKTMSEKGYQTVASGQGSYRDILKDKQEAVSLEQEKRVQKSEDVTERLIGEYETRVKTEPNNLKLLRSLGELYTQKKQFDKALEYYGRVKATDMGGGDATLDQAITDTKVRRFDAAISQLDPKSPDHAEQLQKLQAEKLAFQIEEAQRQVEKNPTDNAVRFEAGKLYFQAGKINEAIQEFQRAQGNPHKRISAMNYLAQCFARKKMFDLAAENLQDAIKEKVVFDDEKKDLIYNLGVVLESMGKKAEAIEQFKIIYKVDAGYRDVTGKIDSYYSQQ
jgi:tetratricopeptide (TPR) repeat protein